MTKDEARHVAAILNAWADGAKIEFKGLGTSNWREYTNLCDAADKIDWISNSPDRYRIKPKPREWWLCFDSDDPKDGATCEAYEKADPRLKLIHVREVTDE